MTDAPRCPPDAPAFTVDPRLDAMRRALAGCTFLPGSPHKRFARDLVHALEITEAQERHLVRLCWRYRRQLPADIVPSKDAVEALDLDWNLRQRAAAERRTADREARRQAKQIAKAGGVQTTFDGVQMEALGIPAAPGRAV